MLAEQVTDPIAYHAEGPVWSTRWGGLRWVDMLAGDALFLRPTARSSDATSAPSPPPCGPAAKKAPLSGSNAVSHSKTPTGH